MNRKEPNNSPRKGIRLGEIFENLEKENDLHEPLMQWFRRAYSSSIDGRIISLNYAYELYLGSWRYNPFGYRLSKRFSSFLETKGSNYDPVSVVEEFCKSNCKFRFSGITSKYHGRIIHIIRLEHLISALEAEYLDYQLTDNRIICQEVKNLLDEQRVLIGHEGIAWFTLYDDDLIKKKDARNVCNLLGIDFIKNRGYVILSLPYNGCLRRPTVFDGGLNVQFRPDCMKKGWGRTLPTNLSEEKVLYESIMKECRHHAKVEKFLPPSDDDPYDPDDESLRQYLERAKRKLWKKGPDAYRDLLRAWKYDKKWW